MTDPLTYLDEVDARTAAATEGPWVEANGMVMHSTFYGLAPVAGNADFIAHARTDLPALSKALRAVLELHRHVQLPISGSSLGDVTYWVGCAHCTRSAEVATYPCPTVQAIQAALAVNDEGGK